MPTTFYPKATVMLGAAAGYARGQAGTRICVCHYTVGVDSTGPGLQGLFEFLVRRNGEVVQFAEVDALTFHACEWNQHGPGIEVEYYEPQDGPTVFTDEARAATGELVHWLNAEWGIPLVYHDGDRLPIGDPYSGFVAHGSLVHHACAQHFDSWPREDWDRMMGEGDDVKLEDVIPGAFDTAGNPLTVGAALGFAANVSALLLEGRNPSDNNSGPVPGGPLDDMGKAAEKVLAGGGGSGGGASPDEVRAIVREEIDRQTRPA